jgi:hypothetical protein
MDLVFSKGRDWFNCRWLQNYRRGRGLKSSVEIGKFFWKLMKGSSVCVCSLMTALLKHRDWLCLRSCSRMFVIFALQLTYCLNRKSSDWGIVWYRNVVGPWGVVICLLHILTTPPPLVSRRPYLSRRGVRDGIAGCCLVFQSFWYVRTIFMTFFVPEYHLMFFV